MCYFFFVQTFYFVWFKNFSSFCVKAFRFFFRFTSKIVVSIIHTLSAQICNFGLRKFNVSKCFSRFLNSPCEHLMCLMFNNKLATVGGVNKRQKLSANFAFVSYTCICSQYWWWVRKNFRRQIETNLSKVSNLSRYRYIRISIYRSINYFR